MDEIWEFLKTAVGDWRGAAAAGVFFAVVIAVLYKPFFKAFLDCLLAFIGLVLLSPLFVLLAVLIKADDPGPVFFRQKRVGKNKKIFTIHKFRTMRTDAPKDVPTHMLARPDAHITRIGRFLRKTSLDELPQIWDIFRLKMSVVGPRPALYNQDDLVRERDKYGANALRPGLTGLAQISGRDELQIPVKAAIDGVYAKKRNVFLDIKIFFATFLKAFKSSGVKEGGTGQGEKTANSAATAPKKAAKKTDAEKRAKNILITGARSYIGGAAEKRLTAEGYAVTVLDMRGENRREFDFSPYGAVIHVAGIAHERKRGNKSAYYAVNRDMAIRTAERARDAGVGQFIFMSSLSIYIYRHSGIKNITAKTVPLASAPYGESKLHADLVISSMNSDAFKTAVVRPPMVYGKNCKGNFPRLVRLADKLPFFPNIKNKRSMLHIDNLCELLLLIIRNNSSGEFFPQDGEYAATSEIVRRIAEARGRRIRFTKLFNPAVYIFKPFLSPLRKLFGDLTYDRSMSEHFGGAYRVTPPAEAVKKSVG